MFGFRCGIFYNPALARAARASYFLVTIARSDMSQEDLGSTADSDELCSLFMQAQQLEDEGDIGFSVDCYAHVVKSCFGNSTSAGGLKTKCHQYCHRPDAAYPKPPPLLIASSALNCIAGHYLDVGNIVAAQHHFREVAFALKDTVVANVLVNFLQALAVWPDNAMAMTNLGNLERNHGDNEVALNIYMTCATLPIHQSDVEWEEWWVVGPRRQCVSYCAYMSALLLHQHGRYQDAVPFLQRFGFSQRLSPSVWQAAHSSACDRLGLHSTDSKSGSNGGKRKRTDPQRECHVSLRAQAIPRGLHQKLCEVFSPVRRC